jgi:hypothetical protein
VSCTEEEQSGLALDNFYVPDAAICNCDSIALGTFHPHVVIDLGIFLPRSAQSPSLLPNYSTNYKALRYAIISILLLHPLPYV